MPRTYKSLFILAAFFCIHWGCGGNDSNGIEWVSIPRGTFQMGCAPNDSKCSDDEKPRHEVRIRPFRMMKTEVTVGMYRKCVEAGRCTNPKTGDYYNWGVRGREDHPINGVDWNQAKAFCEFAGGRLPSEAEWEYAARGTDGRLYPWGNSFPKNNGRPTGNYADKTAKRTFYHWPIISGYDDGFDKTAPACRFPAGNSPFGLCDMTGNVREWVGDCWNGNYNNAPSDGSIWTSGNCPRRVWRGGDWGSDGASRLRAGDRFGFVVGGRDGGLGFRCARTD